MIRNERSVFNAPVFVCLNRMCVCMCVYVCVCVNVYVSVNISVHLSDREYVCISAHE